MESLLKKAEEEGIDLSVRSAYRDKGYQTYLFLATLRQNRHCLSQTAKDVALPEASEHGCLDTPALDFGSSDQDGEEEGPFEASRTFAWLREEAPSLGFEMSFPKGHPFMSYEPWHWRYIKASRLPLAPSTGDQEIP